MALIAYQQITRRLLNDATFAKFNDFDLLDWINIARNQIAAEGEAIHRVGFSNTAIGTSEYDIGAIPIANNVGVGEPVAARMIAVNNVLLSPRSWEWMFEYYIAPGAANGVSVDWGQLVQGTGGSIYLGPPPSGVWPMIVDVVCLPLAIATDADPEALPYPFTDAIPYFAAYMALLTVGDFDTADKMFALYERFITRARALSTPTVLPDQYWGSEGARRAARATPITPSAAVPPPTSGARAQ